ncbi:MAG TPA: Gmad2 immunoglobulin-like domain-containing protein [Dermatophilaceae bacterium]|nr:Gmad2 immunoglobulin-like domain-containing protein [Dermatophilaceae bacterium]
MGQETKPVRRALVVGPVSLALAVALSACGTSPGPDSGQPTSSASTSTSPTGTTTTATSPSDTLTGMPVYWIAESRRSFALYREFREVPNTGGPVSSAVSAMMTLKPLDPDYTTPWRPPSRVTVSQSGNAITVDLSKDALANTQLGSELASRALQQLVYTATAAVQQAGTPASTVTVTVDGAAYDAWGVIRLGEPMQRAPMSEVQAHVWVTSPQEGEDLPAGTVTFKGFGTSFEANFLWEVRNDSGAVVAKGFTMNRTGAGKFGEFTFTAKLTAGTYSVKVSTDDPSDGAEGPGSAVDDKTFTVH